LVPVDVSVEGTNRPSGNGLANRYRKCRKIDSTWRRFCKNTCLSLCDFTIWEVLASPQREEGRDPPEEFLLVTQARLYEFGPFTLDSDEHVLRKGQECIPLTPKTFDTLLLLVRCHGRMLTKEELMRTLWPDSFVEESNLTQQISMVRRALGESANDARFVVTVPARGYRFAVDVSERSRLTSGNGDSTPLPKRPSSAVLTSPAPAVETRQFDRSTSSHRATTFLWPPIAILCAALGLAATFYLLRTRATQPSSASMANALPTLAILPFHNLQPDPNNDFLGFSLADAVITKLGYVSALSVRPSSSVEKYRNGIIDIPKVATELGVNTLLTANFIREGDRLRLTPQLVDSRTQKILWRETLDFRYENLLTVQDEVAVKIVDGLAVHLSPSEAERLRADAPISPMAYEYYLRGIDLYARNDFMTAIKMLEKSVEIDPKYALTWAHLGKAYQANASFNFGGRNQYRSALAAYQRALALDPNQIEARIFMANLFTDTGRVEDAVPILRQAFVSNPNHAELHWELGYAYRFGGMLKESAAECERARQLDPGVKLNSSALNAYLYLGDYDKFVASLPVVNDLAFPVFYRGFGEYYQKNYAAAASDFELAFRLDPSLVQAEVGEALRYAILHQKQLGTALLRQAEQKIEQRGVRDPEALYKIAQAYSALGDTDSALRALERSITGGFFAYSYQATDPLLEPLRGQPKLATLLEQSRARHRAFQAKFF
jgi:DNA-binding winged helix-turn-helix (wHTH) protein/TolB-like protein/Flp pilus assembly protein TadD